MLILRLWQTSVFLLVVHLFCTSAEVRYLKPLSDGEVNILLNCRGWSVSLKRVFVEIYEAFGLMSGTRVMEDMYVLLSATCVSDVV